MLSYFNRVVLCSITNNIRANLYNLYIKFNLNYLVKYKLIFN